MSTIHSMFSLHSPSIARETRAGHDAMDKNMDENMDKNTLRNLLSALDWQLSMGADEDHAIKPLSRFGEAAISLNRAVKKVNMVQDSHSAAATALSSSRKPNQNSNHQGNNPPPVTTTTVPLGSFAASEQAKLLASGCKTLDELLAALEGYEGCPLKNLARHLVFGAGVSQNPDIMVIGDAPDATEDREGQVFTGAPGILIKKALLAGGFSMDKNIYITNSLYWKRPGNRSPNLGEQLSCLPFLLKQIEIINPKQLWIMGIGGVMGFFNSTLAKYQGKNNVTLSIAGDKSSQEIPVLVSQSPDYYWQNPVEKRSLWQDILRIRQATQPT